MPDFNTPLTSALSTNLLGPLIPSAARTTALADIIPDENIADALGIIVFLNVTAASGTGGLQLGVRALMPNTITGGVLLHTLPAAVIATGLTTLMIYPGIAAGAATLAVNSALPPRISIGVAVGDASSYTYSVAAYLLA